MWRLMRNPQNDESENVLNIIVDVISCKVQVVQYHTIAIIQVKFGSSKAKPAMLFFSLFTFFGTESIGKKKALLLAAGAGLKANVEEEDEYL